MAVPGRRKRTRNTRRFRRQVVRRVYGIDPDDLGLSLPCYWCGRRALWSALTIDHMIPLAAGGPDKPENAVLACEPCNQRRDSHRRACRYCSIGMPCLVGLVYRNPAQLCSPICPMSSERARSLRRSKLRFFSLINMVRSGRETLWVDRRIRGEWDWPGERHPF